MARKTYAVVTLLMLVIAGYFFIAALTTAQYVFALLAGIFIVSSIACYYNYNQLTEKRRVEKPPDMDRDSKKQ
jgi:hypothetical protein